VVSAIALHTAMASGPPLPGARLERFFRKGGHRNPNSAAPYTDALVPRFCCMWD
jgi:hypothetical protein